MNKSAPEFQEIAHCGGQFTVTVQTNSEGGREASFGLRHSRPGAAAFYAVYALQPGLPVATIRLGGIGQPWNPPPAPGCLPVFIASDSHGMFGRQCPLCNGYWRSHGPAAEWPSTCPYCGIRSSAHATLTAGQHRYVEEFCSLVAAALASKSDGEHALDMDKVADAAGRGEAKPPFYYAEERQQHMLECRACRAVTDILGRYGYCSNCGTHNGAAELESDINQQRRRLTSATDYASCATEVIAAFDSFARQLAKQLASRIPMTPTRKREWDQRLFHNLQPSADALRGAFDINLLKAIPPDDVAFVSRMFLRRHVYEHNGGEVDARYIEESGDTSVRLKQVIRESRDSASRLADIVIRLGRNMSDGFHEILPPAPEPIRRKTPTSTT